MKRALLVSAVFLMSACGSSVVAPSFQPPVSYIDIDSAGMNMGAITVHVGTSVELAAHAYYQQPAQCNEYGFFCDYEPPPVEVTTDFGWSSSNGRVASVRSDGFGLAAVRGVTIGTATITATASGTKGTVTVTVIGP